MSNSPDNDIVKNWTEAQQELWQKLCQAVPVTTPSTGRNWWDNYQHSLDTWESAVNDSLALQADWLDAWAGRVASEQDNPEVVNRWAAQVEEVLQHWLTTQRQIWQNWFELLRQTSGALADVGELGRDPLFDPALNVAVETDARQAVPVTRKSDRTPEPEPKVTTEAEPDSADAVAANTGTEPERSADSSAAVAEPSSTDTGPTAEAAPTAKIDTGGPTSDGSPDDLKLISGIGPALEQKLKDAGIVSYKQVAKLSNQDIDRLEQDVIRFSGRITRDDWIGQAKAQHLQKYGEQL